MGILRTFISISHKDTVDYIQEILLLASSIFYYYFLIYKFVAKDFYKTRKK